MLSRAAVRRASSSALFSSSRSLRASSFRQLPQVASRTGRRYASGAAGAAKKSSDLPWLAAAIVITVPSCYYILQPSAPHDSGHGGHGHEGHAQESHEEEGEGEAKQGKSDEEGDENKSDEGQEDGGGDESGSKDSPAKKEPKGPEGQGEKIGKGVSSDSADEQGKKQEGLANTDTKHSTDISQNPGKSKKGEGTAESAKVKGTVKPDRPTPEQTNKSDKDE